MRIVMVSSVPLSTAGKSVVAAHQAYQDKTEVEVRL